MISAAIIPANTFAFTDHLISVEPVSVHDKKQGHHQSWDGQLFKEQHDQAHADSGDRETIAKRDEPDNFFKPDRTDDQCNNQ